jgi:hypothetical protein
LFGIKSNQPDQFKPPSLPNKRGKPVTAFMPKQEPSPNAGLSYGELQLVQRERTELAREARKIGTGAGKIDENIFRISEAKKKLSTEKDGFQQRQLKGLISNIQSDIHIGYPRLKYGGPYSVAKPHPSFDLLPPEVKATLSPAQTELFKTRGVIRSNETHKLLDESYDRFDDIKDTLLANKEELLPLDQLKDYHAAFQYIS